MNVIHQSKFYLLSQSDRERKFYLDLGQKTVKMSFCQLLALRQKLSQIAIEDHFDGDLNKHGFEILTLCNKEHLLILNTLEILDLSQLLEDSFVLMGLASPSLVMA